MKRARRKTRQTEELQKKQRAVKTSGKTKKTKKKKKKSGKVLLLLLVILILCVLIALGMGDGSSNALFPVDTSTGKMNVLLMGVDEEGLRTDAMMLASYDFDTESVNMLSIPRDTKMYVTNRKMNRKINEIHALTDKEGKVMGAFASIEAVTALTGMPIHYYVEFSFDSIDHIMDIIGPVEFDVPDVEGGGKGMNYDDPYQDLHIHLKPGLQKLSGNQVQQFLRYRKSNNDNGDGSDTSRIQRQQDFVKALIEQKVKPRLILQVGDIFSTLKEEIKTNFSASEVVRYATHLLKLKPENINSYSLPGESKLQGAWYFVCDLEKTQELIKTVFGYDAEDITNRVEITGQPMQVEAISTKAPEQTSKPEETEKPTKKPEQEEEDEPEQTAPPRKTQEPTEEPEETKEPTTKPTEKPTPKPTEEPEDEDEPIVLD